MCRPSSGSSVVLRGQSERGGIGGGLAGEAGLDRAHVADQRNEGGHRRAVAAALVGLADVGARGQHGLTVGQLSRGGRFVRHQRADQPGMPGHQGQRVDRAAAAAEDVGRPGVHRPDQPAQVVGVLAGHRPWRLAIGALAAPGPAGIVGHHHPVGELPGQGGEAGRTHRRPDEQQDRVPRAAVAHVVVQHGARRLQRVRLWLAHGSRPLSQADRFCPYRPERAGSLLAVPPGPESRLTLRRTPDGAARAGAVSAVARW